MIDIPGVERGDCPAEDKAGMCCTLDVGHVGKHQAWGISSPLSIWAQEDCLCGIPWASPTPRPVCPTHGKPEPSLSRVVADAVNGQDYADGGLQKIPTAGPFMAPIHFLTNHDGGNYVRIEGEWKRDTFPQETQ